MGAVRVAKEFYNGVWGLKAGGVESLLQKRAAES